MLYVSTRDRVDSFTAYRTLCVETTKNGGLFVPHWLPFYSKEELRRICGYGFGKAVAHMLSVFFPVPIKGCDVDLIVGQQLFRTIRMSHRICIAELWHDQDQDYSYFERRIYEKLSGKQEKPTDWSKIAIRIAVLFGLFHELSKRGIHQFDIAVTADDQSSPIAAYYARKMGLPIETIVCSSDEESSLWNLMYQGDCLPVKTPRTHCVFLERLIYDRLGICECDRFLECCRFQKTYQITDDQRLLLSDGLEIMVISRKRDEMLIRNIYRTHRYISSPHMAISYGGLQDYRAGSSEIKTTLLLSDECAPPAVHLTD